MDRNAGAGQLGQKILGRIARTGQPEKDSRRMSGWHRKDKKRGKDGQNITEGKGSWDRTIEMGQPWQDSQP